MFKLRVQLGFIIVLVLGANLLLWHQGASWWRTQLLMSILSSILLVSAGVIVAATFAKAREEQDGAVCFAPDNFIIKLDRAFDRELTDKGQTQICPMYWKLSFLTLISYVILGIVTALICGFYVAILNIAFTAKLLGSVFLAGALGLGLWRILGFVSRRIGALSWVKWLGRILEDGLDAFLDFMDDWGGGLIVALFILGGVAFLIYWLFTTPGAWLRFLAIVGVIAAFVGVIIAALWLVDVIRSNSTPLNQTWLGQEVVKTKDKLCVRIRECDHP